MSSSQLKKKTQTRKYDLSLGIDSFNRNRQRMRDDRLCRHEP